jgi:phenylacetate-CoA oxygenase PaaH subunit
MAQTPEAPEEAPPEGDDDEFILEETHHPEIGESFEGERGRRFAVFVQWEPGDAHQYEESVVSSDPELALSQARRTIERRWDPESIWVVDHRQIAKTKPDDESMAPSTDRSYMTTAYYAREMELPEIADDDEVFG